MFSASPEYKQGLRATPLEFDVETNDSKLPWFEWLTSAGQHKYKAMATATDKQAYLHHTYGNTYLLPHRFVLRNAHLLEKFAPLLIPAVLEHKTSENPETTLALSGVIPPLYGLIHLFMYRCRTQFHLKDYFLVYQWVDQRNMKLSAYHVLRTAFIEHFRVFMATGHRYPIVVPLFLPGHAVGTLFYPTGTCNFMQIYIDSSATYLDTTLEPLIAANKSFINTVLSLTRTWQPYAQPHTEDVFIPIICTRHSCEYKIQSLNSCASFNFTLMYSFLDKLEKDVKTAQKHVGKWCQYYGAFSQADAKILKHMVQLVHFMLMKFFDVMVSRTDMSSFELIRDLFFKPIPPDLCSEPITNLHRATFDRYNLKFYRSPTKRTLTYVVASPNKSDSPLSLVLNSRHNVFSVENYVPRKKVTYQADQQDLMDRIVDLTEEQEYEQFKTAYTIVQQLAQQQSKAIKTLFVHYSRHMKTVEGFKIFLRIQLYRIIMAYYRDGTNILRDSNHIHLIDSLSTEQSLCFATDLLPNPAELRQMSHDSTVRAILAHVLTRQGCQVMIKVSLPGEFYEPYLYEHVIHPVVEKKLCPHFVLYLTHFTCVLTDHVFAPFAHRSDVTELQTKLRQIWPNPDTVLQFTLFETTCQWTLRDFLEQVLLQEYLTLPSITCICQILFQLYYTLKVIKSQHLEHRNLGLDQIYLTHVESELARPLVYIIDEDTLVYIKPKYMIRLFHWGSAYHPVASDDFMIQYGSTLGLNSSPAYSPTQIPTDTKDTDTKDTEHLAQSPQLISSSDTPISDVESITRALYPYLEHIDMFKNLLGRVDWQRDDTIDELLHQIIILSTVRWKTHMKRVIQTLHLKKMPPSPFIKVNYMTDDQLTFDPRYGVDSTLWDNQVFAVNEVVLNALRTKLEQKGIDVNTKFHVSS